MNRRAYLIAALAMLLASAVAAQSSQIAAAIAAGQVGERYDGYMGFATPPSPLVRRQVYAINIQRRNLYTELAVRRNVTASVVGLTTGCQLLRQLFPGEAYQLQDGVWRRWEPGQPPPVPAHCG
jgi:uncharacterized protein YdbL (DUF1318 family)